MMMFGRNALFGTQSLIGILEISILMPMSTYQLRITAFVLGTCFLIGCGDKDTGPKLEPVTGTVTMNDKPLANANLTLLPIGETPGIGGTARSDEAGKFEVRYNRGGEGLPEGKYKVAVSVRQLPDGSPAPPGDAENPIESQARETLPAKFSNIDQSTLEVEVKRGQPVEIKLAN